MEKERNLEKEVKKDEKPDLQNYLFLQGFDDNALDCKCRVLYLCLDKILKKYELSLDQFINRLNEYKNKMSDENSNIYNPIFTGLEYLIQDNTLILIYLIK